MKNNTNNICPSCMMNPCECDKISDYIYKCEYLDLYDGHVYNDEAFLSGITSISKMCGQVFALQKLGLTNEEVINLITLQNTLELDKEARKHELELASINSKMAIDCEKIKAESIEISELIQEL